MKIIHYVESKSFGLALRNSIRAAGGTARLMKKVTLATIPFKGGMTECVEFYVEETR